MAGYVQHVFVWSIFIAILITLEYFARKVSKEDLPEHNFDPFERYGLIVTYILYSIPFLTLLPLPITLFNIIGILGYNTYPEKPALKNSIGESPFICIRVVTRGDFPVMTKQNLMSNLHVCEAVGMEDFVIEVVTDKPIPDFPTLRRTRQVVVPDSYKTKANSLYKARALNYCLEDEVNDLKAKDWIVHLDEETLLTENSIIGIINFASDGSHPFGQGVINYTNQGIVNWVTTLADCFRVAVDHGALRLCLRYFHVPIFSWKGSFVVTNYAAEKQVTYDNGPDGSVAEDCFMAMIAMRDGYTFGYIQGEMHEKSTFTFADFIRQRKRWFQGIYLTYRSATIPWWCKVGLFFMIASWITLPIVTLSPLLMTFTPLPATTSTRLLDIVNAFSGSVAIFMYVFGASKSFSYTKLGFMKYVAMVLASVLTIPFVVCSENIAVLLGMATKKAGFYVVNKDLTPTELPPVEEV